MTFLHPGLLFLIPLAAVPIVLHLLTLYRLKTVELSTFRFLFDSYVQQRRQLKFLEAILAMLRTLFLLFLVLVVARPVAKHWSAVFGSGPGREVIVAVDCSASMNARVAGVASMDRARSVALAIAGKLGAEDRFSLIRLTNRADVAVNRFASDSEAIREGIESLTASPSRLNVYTALSELFSIGTFRKSGQTLYMLTDCQASAWREVKEQGLSTLVPADTHLVVVNVGSSSPIENRAVVGDAPAEHRVIAGLPLTLRPKVVNYSKTEAADVTVALIVDERDAERMTLRLKPGETSAAELVHTPREPGSIRCRYEIARDAFADDDAFLFTLTVVPAIKILVVNGSPSQDPLESESLFLTTALESTAESADADAAMAQLAPARDFARSLDLHEIPESQLNPTALEDSSVVMLANTGSLQAAQFAWLRDFVASGGGLVIWPGDKVNAETYTKQFFSAPLAPAGTKPPARSGSKHAAADAAQPLIDAGLAPAVGELDQVDRFEKLAAIDFAHPIFAVFDDPKAHYLTTARFLRRFPIELAGDRSHVWPLAHFQNGAPAFVEARFGHGIVLLAAFPASSKWSNLPLKPEFVPLVLRIAGHVMRRSELDVPSVVPPDGVAEILTAISWSPVTGRVTDPSRRTAPVNFERFEGRLAGAFERTAERGYYAVEVSGGATEQPRRGTAEFAVNLSPDESDFAMIQSEELAEWSHGVESRLVDASAETQQELGSVAGSDREIWRPLIALMFVLFAVEFFLATLGGRTNETVTIADRIRGLSPKAWVGRMTGAEEDAAKTG